MIWMNVILQAKNNILLKDDLRQEHKPLTRKEFYSILKKLKIEKEEGSDYMK